MQRGAWYTVNLQKKDTSPDRALNNSNYNIPAQLPYVSFYPDGQLISCNSAFSNLIGRHERELRQLKFHFIDESEVNIYSDKIIKGLKPLRRFLSINGIVVPVELFSFPAGPEKEIAIYFCLAIDTGREKESEEIYAAYQQLNDIIEFLPDPTFVIDKNKKVIAWNKAMENMTGVKKEDMINKGDRQYALPFYGRKRKLLIDLVNEKDHVESEYRYVRRCGDTVFGEIYLQHLNGGKGAYLWGKASPLYDRNGNVTGAIESIRDITDKKLVEEELRRSRDELEERVKERTSELLSSNERLKSEISQRESIHKALLDSRSQAGMYVDLMGHDINNMNQIGIGYLGLLLDTPGISDSSRAMIVRSIEVLKNSSKLIENVMKIQKAKAGDIRYGLIDAGKMLDDVMHEFLNIPGKNVEIQYEPLAGCMVIANDLLKDVFINIVGNAIKHSDKALVKIKISLSMVMEDDKEFYRIEISDNGPGIPDSLKPVIFDKLNSENERQRKKGLGLYLVRTLVDDYDGKVRVEDNVPGDPGMGSRFIILLPVPPGNKKLF